MKRIEAVNDFVIKFANVNGSGSASANELFAKSFLRMGIPVSPRTSYQVGRPWMFDGKMLRGDTGIPMRRKLLAKSSFADADPEPLTLANLMTKSFVAVMRGSMRAVVVSVFVGSILAFDFSQD